MPTQRFTPEVGKTYQNRSGGTYLCTHVYEGDTVEPSSNARMVNTATGWTMLCHGLVQYPNGTIEWDYSTGGHFPR